MRNWENGKIETDCKWNILFWKVDLLLLIACWVVLWLICVGFDLYEVWPEKEFAYTIFRTSVLIPIQMTGNFVCGIYRKNFDRVTEHILNVCKSGVIGFLVSYCLYGSFMRKIFHDHLPLLFFLSFFGVSVLLEILAHAKLHNQGKT